MKVVRLTALWSLAILALTLTASFLSPFGVSAETHVGDSMIYPIFRFYRGGAFASLTKSTIETVLFDQLQGIPTSVKDRKAYTKKLAAHLYQLCIDFRLDPAFVLSVIKVESSFRADIISPAGAVGLMQIMPGTARVVSGKRGALDLKDPFLNLTLGLTYLRDLKERYSGLSPYYHLAAYNMGPHRLDQLRAKPTFKPEKTLKYYQDIMRGVESWRRYGLEQKADVARKTVVRTTDPV